jgi:hypothetical protein
VKALDSCGPDRCGLFLKQYYSTDKVRAKVLRSLPLKSPQSTPKHLNSPQTTSIHVKPRQTTSNDLNSPQFTFIHLNSRHPFCTAGLFTRIERKVAARAQHHCTANNKHSTNCAPLIIYHRYTAMARRYARHYAHSSHLPPPGPARC